MNASFCHWFNYGFKKKAFLTLKCLPINNISWRWVAIKIAFPNIHTWWICRNRNIDNSYTSRKDNWTFRLCKICLNKLFSLWRLSLSSYNTGFYNLSKMGQYIANVASTFNHSSIYLIFFYCPLLAYYLVMKLHHLNNVCHRWFLST